ncbi:glycosyltransferase family 87 protein [Streptomyces bohaiensis]|uniref:glycosyltransferase family 87 protein n=1 Tax=Streptomyces bohaiensis TaxID=1431344 RepID=UPI003B7A7ABD
MVHPDARPAVRPSQQDEVAAAGSELLGGPAGRRAGPSGHRWPPVRIIVLAMLGTFVLGMVQKLPCARRGWFEGAATQYTHACYSDIPHLYTARGFADGLIPYFQRIPEETSATMEFLEYPVLTGMFMELASWFTPSAGLVDRPGQYYWLVNAGLLLICAIAIAVCVTRTQPHRPWDGLLVALAPAFALTATINWDLLAVALTAAALLMWSRGRPLAAGVLIGLATAAKLYPLLLLGPLLLLCWRAARLRAFTRTLGGAVGAWAAVNLPFILGATEGWAKFYTFSQERPVDFGSFWLILSHRTDWQWEVESVNDWATLLMLAGCGALAVLALGARRRPRLAQLAFLVVALFILTNKVYSPQYVLWLIPLAALARPRWRDFLIWQGCEVVYFLGIWFYLAENAGASGLPPGGYHLAIVAHLLGTLYLCVLVVRDVLRPEHDIVRRDGSDDPGGGVLDGAADAFTLRRLRRPARGPAAAAVGVPGASAPAAPPADRP